MRYNGSYEVDRSSIKNGSIDWKITGNGDYIIGTRGGTRYFIKRNMHIRRPARGLSKAAAEVMKAQSDAAMNKQKKLRALMRDLDWKKDHIVVEEEHFWDSETNQLVTVTPVVPNVLPDTYAYSSMPLDSFLNLARQAAEMLEKLHRCGVIHGDLKEKNILVSKGTFVPYLIDFDTSYPSAEIPDWESIGGSNGYQSPEVLLYGSDEDAAPKETITPAVDIFSLGVVFHRWWAGSFPGFDLDGGCVGAAVYLDKPVIIDRKFNVRIGDNCGATLLSLINWMFAKDPAQRPTAGQVAAVLSDQAEVPEEFHKGSDAKPFDKELWDAHKLIAELLPVEKLKAKKVRSLKRINEGGGGRNLKYKVFLDDGSEQILTIEELCHAGYAVKKGAAVDEPWKEHRIEFEPKDVIVEKGYARISRVTIARRNRYLMTTISGTQFDKGPEWLIQEGLAHPKIVEVEADTPWPEHGTEYDFASMAQMNVKSISRMDVGGQHRYRIVYYEIVDGKNKVNERVPANNLKLMGFIK